MKRVWQTHRREEKFMKLLPWNPFPLEIEAYTVTKYFGDMSFNNPDSHTVLNNRIQLSKYLHTTIEKMVAPRQTHTNHLQKVSKADGGTNMRKIENKLENTDALYTSDSDLFLVTFHADCTPILLYCRDTGIVSSIHSGWLGTTRQITTTVLKHLIEVENCNPKEIYAYIGPSIEKHNYEVQQDVISQIQKMDFDTSKYYEQRDATHFLLDNKGLNKQQLLNVGIPRENITVSTKCTIDNNDLLFSHRKKEAGRNITIIRKNR